ncbi:MAG: hypothetical protein AVDCRST_MAG60-1293 [uncultured Nocardioides sp.]|uniref:Uncharacterized protein n=1 Tax=uncultured Nocardioides sp. TaxID=198441 RepID=A0A6J4NIF1_9ACTN|nr:MAG: hypothetical protein AVDCRST_MAG60-1293 [uncultured Nocardioides sp.]
MLSWQGLYQRAGAFPATAVCPSTCSASATALSLTGAGSVAAVSGLVEQVVIDADGASLRADRTHLLVVRGSSNVTDARRGFRTRVVGNANAVSVVRPRR